MTNELLVPSKAEERVEDTKRVIRSRKSTDNKYDSQTKKDKRKKRSIKH